MADPDEKNITADDVKQEHAAVVELAPQCREWMYWLRAWNMEMRGTQPVPIEERTDTEYGKICYIFLSSNTSILVFSIGSIGPVSFGLGVRDSCLIIVGLNLVCAILTAYFATWGSKLGMRQMILSRYSFGYYGVIVPCILNLATVVGFSVTGCIVGGQALASVSNGNFSWTVGIVVFTIISVLASFGGYRFLNWYEKVAWIPIMMAFVVVVAIGGRHLLNLPPAPPATAASILGFAGTQAGNVVTWSGYAADYSIYLRPRRATWKLFWAAYIGIFVPTTLIACVGAAFSAAAPSVSSWNDGYAGGNIGGLLKAILRPVGGFGEFLTVLLSLSVAANTASLFYSASFNFQVLIPRLVLVPRHVFTVVTAAVVLPISIVGAHHFYAAITNFMSLIGYWCVAYVAILVVEHIYFRKNNFANYDPGIWNVPSRLPLGCAALGSGILSLGLIIPCVSQVWFTGPIAKTTGDLGFGVAFILNLVLYPPLRLLEIKYSHL